jgi:hypothetical protein
MNGWRRGWKWKARAGGRWPVAEREEEGWLVVAGGVLSYLTFINISFWQSIFLLLTYLRVQMHQNIKINIQR